VIRALTLPATCVTALRRRPSAGTPSPVVDPARIETLTRQIASYKASIAAFKRTLTELISMPETPDLEKMLKANTETLRAITRSLELAEARLEIYRKAPRLPRPKGSA